MKLIDKDTLVAEIERIEYETNYEPFTDEVFGKRKVCKDIKDFLDTLEVKGLDLGKEIKEVQRNYKTIEEYEGYPCTIYADDIKWIAKYFYELGLKTKGECMPCVFNTKPENRDCRFCTATICDEKQPKQVETFTTNKIE